MAYISTEEVKAVRNELKKTFPNVKFSVTTRHYSSIQICILEAPINLLEGSDRQREQINHYYIKENYTGKTKEMLLKIFEIASRNERIVSEDADYGSIPNYYIHMEIGQWNKPFIFKN